MAKVNPKKWFPGHMALISLRKVDLWAERQRACRPYFDTWDEAHDHMLSGAKTRLERAKREAESAKRHLAKVQAMKTPNEGP